MNEYNRPEGLEGEDHEYVWVPLWMIENLGSLPDEWVRLILYFYLHGKQTGRLGNWVPLGELAEGSGLSLGRARLGLGHLLELKLVEPAGEHDWRLKREPLTFPILPLN